MTVTGSLLKNAAWGGMGELVARVAKIAQVMILVRWLGAEQFGRFNHAASLVGLFAVFFDLGIATIAVREIARHPNNRFVLLEYGMLKVLSSAVGLILVTIWAFASFPFGADRRLVLLMALYLWLIDFSSYVFVIYRARQQFWKEAAVRFVTSLLQLAVCILTLYFGGNVTHLVAALALSASIGLVPLVVEFRRKEATFRPVPLRQLWGPLKECIPVVGSAVASAIYMNCDILILAQHASMEEVGWYSVAVKAVFGVLIMPIHFFSLASLPILSAQTSARGLAASNIAWLENFSRTTFIGAIMALGVGLFARPLLNLFFGKSFGPAAPILFYFILPCFFYYLYTPLAQWVLLQHRQSRSTLVSGCSALLNVLLLLWLVPLLGILGATLAAVATHASLALGHLRLASAAFTGKEAGWRRVTSTVLAFGISWLFRQFAPLPEKFLIPLTLTIFATLTIAQWSYWVQSFKVIFGRLLATVDSLAAKRPGGR